VDLGEERQITEVPKQVREITEKLKLDIFPNMWRVWAEAEDLRDIPERSGSREFLPDPRIHIDHQEAWPPDTGRIKRSVQGDTLHTNGDSPSGIPTATHRVAWI